MTDEEYTFRADCAEKKRVARGSANRRSHAGKGGRMKMPSDYMTKKERDKMNGEVKRYSMAHPMKWAQFKQMPDDIKREYIASITDKFNPTQAAVAEMLGVTQRTLSSLYTALGIPSPRGCRSASGRNDAFWAWANAATTAEPTDAAEKPEGKTMQKPQGGGGRSNKRHASVFGRLRARRIRCGICPARDSLNAQSGYIVGSSSRTITARV